MILRMPNGAYLNMPEGLTEDQQYFFLKGKLQPPSVGERFVGTLGSGTATGIETMANIYQMFGAKEGAAKMHEGAAKMRAADFVQRTDLAPPTSLPGKAVQGFVEFLPQVPLYSAGEFAALKALPLMGRAGAAVARALEPVAESGAVKDIAKSMGRAAIGGGVVGTLGAEPGSGVTGSLAEGAREAAAFAGAVGVFGTLFKLLGASSRGLLRAHENILRDMNQREMATLIKDLQDAQPEGRREVFLDRIKETGRRLATDALRTPKFGPERFEPPKPEKVTTEPGFDVSYEALEQQFDHLKREHAQLEDQLVELRQSMGEAPYVQNLNEVTQEAQLARAAENNAATIARLKDRVANKNASKATVRRLLVTIREQRAENEKLIGGTERDQANIEGVGGAERVGEEPGRPVQVAPTGEEAPRTGGDVQAHEVTAPSLLAEYKAARAAAKDKDAFDDFGWFDRHGVGDRWELHKRGYPIDEVLGMADDDVTRLLLSKTEPGEPTADDLLKWQTRQANITETQMARRKTGSTVKAETRSEDRAEQKLRDDRLAQLEAEQKADLEMLNRIEKADTPEKVDSAVAATVKTYSREEFPELYAQLEQAYTSDALTKMQEVSDFEKWRGSREAKTAPYNLTRPTHVVAKEGTSTEVISERERGRRFEGEEEQDVHRQRGVTLSFLGTGELHDWFSRLRETVRMKAETTPLLRQPTRDINTLKDIQTFLRGGKYEIPPRVAKEISDVTGENVHLYDLTESRASDVNRMSEWFVPTLRQFDGHPGASRAIYELIAGDQTAGYNQGIHFSIIRNAVAGLTQAERKLLKPVIEKKIAAPAHVLAAAQKITGWLTQMKERYKAHLWEMFNQSLSADELRAFNDAISGVPIADAAKAAKVKPNLLKSFIKTWDKINDWGLDPETYIPHVERGTIKLMEMTDKGRFKTLAFAVNREHAIEKVEQLVKEGHTEIYMDTSVPEYMKDIPEPVRPMQAFRIESRLKKAIAEDLTEINKGIKVKHLLRGALEVRPTKKFSPFEHTRRNIVAGEEDVVPVLYAYAHTMETKMQLDPVIDKIQDLIPHLPANMRNSMVNLVEDVKGRRWMSDQVTEEFFNKFGVSVGPRPFSRFVSKAKMTEAMFKFAYRPISGIINAASAAGHIWTKVGTKYLLDGIGFMRTAEGKRLLDSVRNLLGTDIVAEMSGKTHGKLHVWHPLGMFQLPEKAMRELSLCANYLLAKDKGLAETSAIEFAVRANWMQNFIYNTAALPRSLRTPVGRLLGQFKPYLIQEVNFISQLRGIEAARYLAVMATLGGPIGYIATLKTLPILSMFPWWNEVEEYVNTNFPRLSRGLPGALGVDVSAPATFQFPTKWEDWAGPFFSDLVKVKKEVIDPLSRGEILNVGEVGKKLAGQTIPIAKHWSNAVELLLDPEGWVKDDRGRRLYHIGTSPWDRIPYVTKAAFGAKDLEASVLQKHEAFVKEEARVRATNKQQVIDEFLDLVGKGKDVTPDILNALVEFNVKKGSLRRAAKFRLLDAQTRRFIMTEVAKRPEILEEWPQVE